MSRITESAEGEQCQVRLPGICSFDRHQTVWAHANGHAAGKGLGIKSPDALGTYACFHCHMIIDGQLPLPQGMTREEMLLAFHEGHQRSFRILLDKKLVICP